ncbi:hypothetical protein AVEN_82819-1 [Araneus ventricosus]|uniref:Uncharacterized protein n=1 Tax=Araneus ventricosus TaxID=182803 RepID=A0A4Y2F9A8_ARAVE|nr:hypothetical protein AVEN_82819-1 [Araneus ventricosus]
MFYNIFDTVPERLFGNTDNLYFVLDGGSLIHRVVWPKQETFGDVYITYMSYIKRHYGDETTVVFDGYTESSVNIKPLENVGIRTFVATDDADVHIVKTTIETYEKIKKQVVIGQDVDILVLLIALTPVYIDILMLKEGKGKVKDRFCSSKDLQNSNLMIECTKKSILFVHAISGCDTTSGFYRKGNLQAVQLLNLIRLLSSFFVLLYNATMNLSPALPISV